MSCTEISSFFFGVMCCSTRHVFAAEPCISCFGRYLEREFLVVLNEASVKKAGWSNLVRLDVNGMLVRDNFPAQRIHLHGTIPALAFSLVDGAWFSGPVLDSVRQVHRLHKPFCAVCRVE